MQGEGKRSRLLGRQKLRAIVLVPMLVALVVGFAVPAPEARAAAGTDIDQDDPAQVFDTWRTILAPAPPMSFSGNIATCDPGTTAAPFRAAQLRVVNALRRLDGLDPVTENPDWSHQAQNTALMMAAAGELSHFPGPSWPCYSTEGAAGAASSNLFLGARGTTATIGYIADPGASNAAVGHRRWMLCPALTQVGFGDTPTTNATKVFDGPGVIWESGDGFVAWPNPGLVPANLAGPRGLLDRFSVQFPRSVSVRGAAVTIHSSSGGTVRADSLNRDDEPYCGPALAFQPSRPPEVGETWTISVNGLQTPQGDSAPGVSYQSTFTVLSPWVPFVKAAFEDFLGRLPSSTELAREVRALDRTTTKVGFLSGLSRSSEWISRIVDGYYQDTLGRPADPAGRAYWVTQLASGRRTVAQVAAMFYGSDEYFRVKTHSDLRQWVGDLYQKLLARTPDPVGLAFWVNRAARSGRMHVATMLFQSSESCRARVRSLYDRLLGRPPDRLGLTFWAGRLPAVGDLTLAVDLASSDEYAARADRRY